MKYVYYKKKDLEELRNERNNKDFQTMEITFCNVLTLFQKKKITKQYSHSSVVNGKAPHKKNGQDIKSQSQLPKNKKGVFTTGGRLLASIPLCMMTNKFKKGIKVWIRGDFN